MSVETLFIVQQFEKRGKSVRPGQQFPFKSEGQALGRAERDARRCAGVVAVRQTVETESGEVLDEPKILFRAGDLPRELAAED